MHAQMHTAKRLNLHAPGIQSSWVALPEKPRFPWWQTGHPRTWYSKFLISTASETTASIMANWSPTHLRGPPLKGMYLQVHRKLSLQWPVPVSYNYSSIWSVGAVRGTKTPLTDRKKPSTRVTARQHTPRKCLVSSRPEPTVNDMTWRDGKWHDVTVNDMTWR